MDEIVIHEDASRTGAAMSVDNSSMPGVPVPANQGNDPESLTHHGKKKEKRFGTLRFGFGGKKKKASDEDSAAIDKTNVKKAKKEKKNRSHKASSPEASRDGEESAGMNTDTSLPEANVPAPLKRPKSKSKLAGSLVRKLSFGTLNAKRPVIEKRSQTRVEASPTISNEDLDSNASTSTSTGNRQGLDGDDGASYYSSGEYVSLSSPPSTLSPSPMETDEEGMIHLKKGTCLLSQDGTSTATPPQSGGQAAKHRFLKQHALPVPDEIITLATSEIENSVDQSETSSVCRRQPPSQSSVATSRVNPVDEPPPQTPMERRQETSTPVEQHSDAAADVAGDVHTAPATEDAPGTLGDVSAESPTFVPAATDKPVGSLSDVGSAIVAAPLPADSHAGDTASGESTSIATETYRLRTAWIAAHDMNTGRGDVESREPAVDDVQAKPPEQPSTMEQILSITTPIWERQRMEAEGQVEDSASQLTLDGSVASSSRSEVFFTPRDSPSPRPEDSEVDTDSMSPEAPYATPRAHVTFTTSEESYSPPEERGRGSEGVGPRTGEDIMAQARARLSHNLSISSPSATQIGEKREHLYKILVIGDLGTGKTSIIKRYVHQFFSQHYRATIGVDFALKVLNWDANTIIRLQLWDIAGQERFGTMTRVYYKEAVGAFIVFDVARAATFDAVVKWKQDLDAKVQLPDGSPIPCVLLANKCDQQKEGLVNSPAKMEDYCREKGFAGWFETSAKENINIEEAARFLVTKILSSDQLRTQSEYRDREKINLETAPAFADRAKSKCSC